MSGNGVSGYGYLDASYGYNEYFKNLTGFFTRSLNYAPGNIWNARMATQMWNSTTYSLAFPYGQYYNFTGRPRYVVASSYELPYSVAMGLQGYPTRSTYADLIAARDSVTMQHQLSSRPQRVHAQLERVKTIGIWKDNEALADNPELQKEAKELAEEAEKLAKKLELVMKNEAGLDSSSVLASVAEIEKEAATLDTKAKELCDKCRKIEEEYNKKKAEEANTKIEEEADSPEDDDAADETTVPTNEGDKKMDTDALAKEYGVKKPVISAEQDVSSVVKNVKLNTNNSNDEKNHTDFMNMFTTGELNSKNIIEVLDGVLNSGYDLYDGIYEMDNSNEAMAKVITTIRTRINELKAAGYLDDATAKSIRDALTLVENKLGNGTDIPSSSPKFNWGSKKNLDVNGILKEIVAKLEGKGTQADFDAKVKAKQAERTKKATGDFYKDHATSRVGKEVNGTPALPAGVTYLPNSKEFQWKYDSTTIFKGKSYKELGEKILASKKTEVISKWNEILKEMDKQLKDKPAS